MHMGLQKVDKSVATWVEGAGKRFMDHLFLGLNRTRNADDIEQGRWRKTASAGGKLNKQNERKHRYVKIKERLETRQNFGANRAPLSRALKIVKRCRLSVRSKYGQYNDYHCFLMNKSKSSSN